MAETPKVEEKKQPEVAKQPEAKKERKQGEPHVNLPPTPKSLKGTGREAVLINWKEQFERGLLHRCQEKGCYYPLKHVTNNIGQAAVTKGGRFVMQCTWDTSHGGGEQLVDRRRRRTSLGTVTSKPVLVDREGSSSPLVLGAKPAVRFFTRSTTKETRP